MPVMDPVSASPVGRLPASWRAGLKKKNRSHSVRGCLSGNPDTDCRWLSRPIRLRVRPQGVQPSLEFRMDSNALAFAPARHLTHGFHYRSRSHGVAFACKRKRPAGFPHEAFSYVFGTTFNSASGAVRRFSEGRMWSVHACSRREAHYRLNQVYTQLVVCICVSVSMI
jgi:hypothetical protein